MKNAVIIVYDGSSPSLDAQKAAANALAEYGHIHDIDRIEVYVLDETAIVSAIAAKAVVDAAVNEDKNRSEEERAAIIIFDQFSEAIIKADYDEFMTALSCKLAVDIAQDSDSVLIDAVRTLSRDEAEKYISRAIKVKYHLTQKVFATIRRVFNLICQGRQTIIR